MSLAYHFVVLISSIVVLIASIGVHEAGHKIQLQKYTGKKIKLRYRRGVIRCGFKEDYRMISNDEYISVLATGVIFGLVPIIIILILGLAHVAIISLAGYIAGSRHDLRLIYKWMKKLD